MMYIQNMRMILSITKEILETLAYADENKANEALIDSILEKARLRKGLSTEKASVLLACPMEEKSGNLQTGREQIKKDFYGKPDRHVRTALSFQLLRKRLYILPVSSEKQTYRQKTADLEEIRKEVIALQDMGHKRLALEAGKIPYATRWSTIWTASKPFTASNTKTAPSDG